MSTGLRMIYPWSFWGEATQEATELVVTLWALIVGMGLAIGWWRG